MYLPIVAVYLYFPRSLDPCTTTRVSSTKFMVERGCNNDRPPTNDADIQFTFSYITVLSTRLCEHVRVIVQIPPLRSEIKFISMMKTIQGSIPTLDAWYAICLNTALRNLLATTPQMTLCRREISTKQCWRVVLLPTTAIRLCSAY